MLGLILVIKVLFGLERPYPGLVGSGHPTSGAALEKTSEPLVAASACALPFCLNVVFPTVFYDNNAKGVGSKECHEPALTGFGSSISDPARLGGHSGLSLPPACVYTKLLLQLRTELVVLRALSP